MKPLSGRVFMIDVTLDNPLHLLPDYTDGPRRI